MLASDYERPALVVDRCSFELWPEVAWRWVELLDELLHGALPLRLLVVLVRLHAELVADVLDAVARFDAVLGHPLHPAVGHGAWSVTTP